MTSTPRVNLNVIEVDRPCPADWSAMAAVDGDRVRFCKHCEHAVYDLSALTRPEAEALVAAHAGDRLCVRLYKRGDGTVVTADCGGRWRAAAGRWAARWGGWVGVILAATSAAFGCDDRPPRATTVDTPRVLTGMIAAPPPATAPTTQPIATTQP
jgi:hypothetical protein